MEWSASSFGNLRHDNPVDLPFPAGQEIFEFYTGEPLYVEAPSRIGRGHLNLLFREDVVEPEDLLPARLSRLLPNLLGDLLDTSKGGDIGIGDPASPEAWRALRARRDIRRGWKDLYLPAWERDSEVCRLEGTVVEIAPEVGAIGVEVSEVETSRANARILLQKIIQLEDEIVHACLEIPEDEGVVGVTKETSDELEVGVRVVDAEVVIIVDGCIGRENQQFFSLPLV